MGPLNCFLGWEFFSYGTLWLFWLVHILHIFFEKIKTLCDQWDWSLELFWGMKIFIFKFFLFCGMLWFFGLWQSVVVAKCIFSQLFWVAHFLDSFFCSFVLWVFCCFSCSSWLCKCFGWCWLLSPFVLLFFLLISEAGSHFASSFFPFEPFERLFEKEMRVFEFLSPKDCILFGLI